MTFNWRLPEDSFIAAIRLQLIGVHSLSLYSFHVRTCLFLLIVDEYPWIPVEACTDIISDTHDHRDSIAIVMP